MKDAEHSRSPDGAVGDGEDTREPYEAPRLESEELFEVLALACGKTHSVSKFQCQRFNRTS